MCKVWHVLCPSEANSFAPGTVCPSHSLKNEQISTWSPPPPDLRQKRITINSVKKLKKVSADMNEEGDFIVEERTTPFALVLYDAKDAIQQWLPSGDIEAPPWERCFAQFLRQLYDRSRSEKSVRDYRRTLIVFFASSAQGGPPKHPEDYTREDVEDSSTGHHPRHAAKVNHLPSLP